MERSRTERSDTECSGDEASGRRGNGEEDDSDGSSAAGSSSVGAGVFGSGVACRRGGAGAGASCASDDGATAEGSPAGGAAAGGATALGAVASSARSPFEGPVEKKRALTPDLAEFSSIDEWLRHCSGRDGSGRVSLAGICGDVLGKGAKAPECGVECGVGCGAAGGEVTTSPAAAAPAPPESSAGSEHPADISAAAVGLSSAQADGSNATPPPVGRALNEALRVRAGWTRGHAASPQLIVWYPFLLAWSTQTSRRVTSLLLPVQDVAEVFNKVRLPARWLFQSTPDHVEGPANAVLAAGKAEVEAALGTALEAARLAAQAEAAGGTAADAALQVARAQIAEVELLLNKRHLQPQNDNQETAV